jgi:hypothetical protein
VIKDRGDRYVDFLERSQCTTDINLDYYQHPDKRRNPTLRYSRAFDIFSLGCLLLEIGYWKPLHHLVDVKASPEAMRKQLQTLAVKLDG